MDEERGPNMVAVFLGGSTLFVLFVLLIVINSGVYKKAADPANYPTSVATTDWSNPPQYSTETMIVHNKAVLIVMGLGLALVAALILIMVVSSRSNQKIKDEINQYRRK